MKSAEQIIKEGTANGLPLSAIQAELRRGFNPKSVSVEAAVQSLALMIEEVVRLSVQMFAESLRLLGAEVNQEGMANAYLASLRLSQDAFFYDVENLTAVVETPLNVDEDGFEYEATIVGEEE